MNSNNLLREMSIPNTLQNFQMQLSPQEMQPHEMEGILFAGTASEGSNFPSQVLGSFSTPPQQVRKNIMLLVKLDLSNKKKGKLRSLCILFLLIVKYLSIYQKPQETSNQELKAHERMLKKQEEQHKQQLIHVETVGIMTKYQLVFIKLETSLTKVSNIIKKREQSGKLAGFKAIQQISLSRGESESLQSKLIYRIIDTGVSGLVSVMNRLVKKQLLLSLNRIQLVNTLRIHEQKLKQEHEKFKKEFVLTLNKKDQELQQASNQNQEADQYIFTLKNKEIDVLSKLRVKEQQVQLLQKQVTEINNLPNPAPQPVQKQTPQQQAAVRSLEQRVREAEMENAELKEKLMVAESNVTSFIRDMGDMLDTHELSTNIVSEDNISLNNSHLHPQMNNELSQQQKQIQQYENSLNLNEEQQVNAAGMKKKINGNGVNNVQQQQNSKIIANNNNYNSNFSNTGTQPQQLIAQLQGQIMQPQLINYKQKRV